MNAQHEIDRLLEESGAVLVRQNNHLVYRLPNGKNFVAAKTSSDPNRAAKNSLSDLRRALGTLRAAPEAKGEQKMRIEQMPVVRVPAPETQKIEALKHRIEAAVAREEGQQEQLLALAQQIERRVAMLRALLPFAADPATEEVLRAVLPALEVASPLPPEVRLEPPQQITERVQVTRQIVFAATQTFDNTFTVNDVLSLMSGGRQIDGEERLRVRSAIAQAMTTLYERGELVKEAEGIGKRQTIWRKAALKGSGNGNRTRG